VTTEALYKELNYVNHSREKRKFYANLVIDQPELIPQLLEVLFMVNDKISPRAAWVLEFFCNDHLEKFIPYLDILLPQLKHIKLDSALRPCAKICEYIAKAYSGKEKNTVKTSLTNSQKEQIIEACFDWMITEQKVAVKAYSMTTLYLFGKEFDWIYPELRIILERDFSFQSAAFKARARQILKKI
jgi:hypothetical protein